MPREHGDSGEFVETVTLDDVRAVFDEVAGPVVLSADVADALGCSRETARRKLQQLHDRGDLDRRKVARRVIYWRVDESGHEPGVTASGGSADRTDPSPSPTGETASTGAHTDQGAEAILRELDLPGSGAKLDGRITAVLQMYDHLQAHAGDPVTKSALLDVVDADAVGYASLESFWNNFVKANTSQGRATNALVALPGVEEWGRGEYRYTES